jgi:hypothetical protein
MAATCHRRFPDIARSRPSGLSNQQPLLAFPGTRSSRRPRLIAGAVVGAALITSAIVVDDDLSTRQRFEKFGDERTQVRFARAGCGEQRELRRRLRRKRHRVGFDEGGKLLPKRMNFGSGNQLTLPLPPLQSRKLRPFLNQRDAMQQELASGIQIQFANAGRDIEPRLPL